MPVGGARKGAGRPKGTLAKVTNKTREAAMATGLLPHEWLLKISRGEMITQQIAIRDIETGEVSYELMEIYPDFDTRVEAAKSAAPYYAPRLATQNVKLGGGVGLGILDPKALRGLSPHELDNMIALLSKALGSIGEFNG